MNDKTLNSALKYITLKDRSCAEIERYLKNKEYIQEDIADTLAYLKEMKYVDDENYAMRFASELCQKCNGGIKIKGELVKKGISSEIIEMVLDELEVFEKEDEKNRALTQAKKLMLNFNEGIKITNEDDYETKKYKYKEQQRLKGKIGRKLMSKGFSNRTVFSVIDVIWQEYFE